MGRVLGVDLGSRRIGLAVSDPTGVIASPLRVLERTADPAADHEAIVAAAREVEAATVVIGLPTQMSGRAGDAARAARGERDAIAALAPDLVVELVDERLTTVIAQRAMTSAGVRRKDRRNQIDKVAAAVILQSYLDARR
ncbi:MAG: Holliday junction resolvase RuvX [Acidimicrobiia bacterium]